MEKIETKIPEVLILKSLLHQDERGFLAEMLNLEDLRRNGIQFSIAQVNHSFSEQIGTLRGLHFQTKPFQQTKIVACLRGAIYDVAVDLRPNSPYFLSFVSFLILSAYVDFDSLPTDLFSNIDLIVQYPDKVFIPCGFAHGFLTLLPKTEVIYFADNFYSQNHDRTIRYDDPQISIPWPKLQGNFILSAKDRNAPFVRNFDFSML
ncbi:MAG: dTDP-4-dehydrorhamnose 3,5-epimerase family protein [Candidatus Kapaibacteriota bacterium]